MSTAVNMRLEAFTICINTPVFIYFWPVRVYIVFILRGGTTGTASVPNQLYVSHLVAVLEASWAQ